MTKTRPYNELLAEIALAIEAGNKTDELAWKAVLQSNYEVTIEGRRYLDLNPRNHKPLDQYLKGILQWRPSNPIRKIKYLEN